MAQNEFLCICFYPEADEKHPVKYRVRKLDSFNRFAARKGYIYYNQYQKETGDFVKKHWFEENFPRNKKTT